MDPVTILGLASSIIAIIDFSSKFLKKSYELHKLAEDGQSLDGDNTSIKTAIETVERLSNDLSSPFDPASAEEREMAKLADDCRKVADQLLTVLKKLEIGIGQDRSRLSTLRQTIRLVFSKEEIERLLRRIDVLRNALHLCLENNI